MASRMYEASDYQYNDYGYGGVFMPFERLPEWDQVTLYDLEVGGLRISQTIRIYRFTLV